MTIILDTENEILYGSDQACVSYPTRFATVSLPLVPPEDLLQAVNSLRVGLEPVDEIELTVGLNDYTAMKLDNCIEAVITAVKVTDVEERYSINSAMKHSGRFSTPWTRNAVQR